MYIYKACVNNFAFYPLFLLGGEVFCAKSNGLTACLQRENAGVFFICVSVPFPVR